MKRSLSQIPYKIDMQGVYLYVPKLIFERGKMKDSKNSKVHKEELFVGIPANDNSGIDYHAISRYMGQKLPYSNSKATCALRVTSDVAAFSLLFLTKVTSVALNNKMVEFPKGPLMKLEKKALSYGEIPENVFFVEYEDQKYELTYNLDPNGVLTIDGPTVKFERPKSALQIYIFFSSKIVKRTVALGFIGHLGKPGEADNLVRVVSKVVKSATGLGNFYAISGFEAVDVPPSPRAGSIRITRKLSEKAAIQLPVWLYGQGATPEMLATGLVDIDVNLDVSGIGSSRILFNLTPSKEIEAIFEQYRNVVSNTALKYLTDHLGESEIREIAAEIAIEDVGHGTIGRLKEALLTIPQTGIDFSPTMFQPHS